MSPPFLVPFSTPLEIRLFRRLLFNYLQKKSNYILVAKSPYKTIAVAIEELIRKIDRSDLPAGQEEAFKTWLLQRISMQITVETALRKGYSVKASSYVHSKKLEY